MEILLSDWYKGNPETGIHYGLFTAPMFDDTKIFGILRDYGNHSDGTPSNAVSLICVDDGTVESFQRACRVFYSLVDVN